MSLVRVFQLRLETLHMYVSAAFHFEAEKPKPKTRCIFKAFRVSELWIILDLNCKVVDLKKLVLQSGVRTMASAIWWLYVLSIKIWLKTHKKFKMILGRVSICTAPKSDSTQKKFNISLVGKSTLAIKIGTLGFSVFGLPT